ncbi:MAG: hypothetical protein JW864_01130 [Spirochaetes bacterium]|nr:hypothetical protein [Spirochaetota bacterium]
MKKITAFTLSAFLIIIPVTALSQTADCYYSGYELIEYSSSEYISLINNSETGISEKTESLHTYEHPLRRFEITFFISLPFTFILTFVTLHVADVLKQKNTNVNVWEDFKPALLTGTFGLSSLIAFREAWICMETNKEKREQEKEKQGLKDSSFIIYAKKRF